MGFSHYWPYIYFSTFFNPFSSGDSESNFPHVSVGANGVNGISCTHTAFIKLEIYNSFYRFRCFVNELRPPEKMRNIYNGKLYRKLLKLDVKVCPIWQLWTGANNLDFTVYNLCRFNSLLIKKVST